MTVISTAKKTTPTLESSYKIHPVTFGKTLDFAKSEEQETTLKSLSSVFAPGTSDKQDSPVGFYGPSVHRTAKIVKIVDTEAGGVRGRDLFFSEQRLNLAATCVDLGKLTTKLDNFANKSKRAGIGTLCADDGKSESRSAEQANENSEIQSVRTPRGQIMDPKLEIPETLTLTAPSLFGDELSVSISDSSKPRETVVEEGVYYDSTTGEKRTYKRYSTRVATNSVLASVVPSVGVAASALMNPASVHKYREMKEDGPMTMAKVMQLKKEQNELKNPRGPAKTDQAGDLYVPKLVDVAPRWAKLNNVEAGRSLQIPAFIPEYNNAADSNESEEGESDTESDCGLVCKSKNGLQDFAKLGRHAVECLAEMKLKPLTLEKHSELPGMGRQLRKKGLKRVRMAKKKVAKMGRDGKRVEDLFSLNFAGGDIAISGNES